MIQEINEEKSEIESIKDKVAQAQNQLQMKFSEKERLVKRIENLNVEEINRAETKARLTRTNIESEMRYGQWSYSRGIIKNQNG